MSLLERAVAHYKNLPRDVIEVPEWADENGPAKIFYSIPTLQEVEKVRRESKGGDMEMAARLIVLKAEDEAGGKLFQVGDHIKLLRACHPEVVSRISAEITKHLIAPDPGVAEKNSEAISED